MNPEDAAVEGFRVAFRLAAVLSVGTLILATTLRATPSVEREVVASSGGATGSTGETAAAEGADTDIEERAQTGSDARS